MTVPPVELPAGVRVGHHTDRERWTGCTVILPPEGTVASCEVRGGGPGTRESDQLSPASASPGVHALLLTGGSAFGLSAAAGVVRWLAEREIGSPTPVAAVPLVPGAVVYDLFLGRPEPPDPDDAYAACDAAAPDFERGSVGAGTGCTVGKLLGPDGWTKGGVGAASMRLGDAIIAAVAVANPFGEVVGADGAVAAGAWRDGAYVRTSELLAEGVPGPPARESTTLVAVLTDAALSKTQAWLVARAATGGVSRAVHPSATAVDGDVVYVMATGRVPVEPFAVSALAADVSAAAIRDAVQQATDAPGCPAAVTRAGGARPPSG
ncbi:MAG TPA: P1 family peptidase [Solirubrobacteraceae bacterium]|nr:P1 family peptidase [Solirubrobacteraceae bacterium]